MIKQGRHNNNQIPSKSTNYWTEFNTDIGRYLPNKLTF
jgi:hypothetical protein